MLLVLLAHPAAWEEPEPWPRIVPAFSAFLTHGEWTYWGSATLILSRRSSCSRKAIGMEPPTPTPLTGTEKCLASDSMAVPLGYFVGTSEPHMRRT